LIKVIRILFANGKLEVLLAGNLNLVEKVNGMCSKKHIEFLKMPL